MYSSPIAYFITFTTRGTRLHGCEKGSVDRNGRYIDVFPEWEETERDNMKFSPILFTKPQREIVHDAISKYCIKRSWKLYILAVQSNHIHILLTADNTDPDSVATSLKSAASLELHKQRQFPDGIQIWTRFARTRYVFNDEEFQSVFDYINNQ